MAIEVWCELVCAVCAQRSNGTWCFGATLPRYRLMELAIDWKFKMAECYCPKCAPAIPNAKPFKLKAKVVSNDTR